MPDREESHRPQDRDFTIDQWEKFPFKRKDDPYENRSEDRAEAKDQSQYKYEGWEHNAFPNEDVSEQPADGAMDEKANRSDRSDGRERNRQRNRGEGRIGHELPSGTPEKN
jgi:hypothetical protein